MLIAFLKINIEYLEPTVVYWSYHAGSQIWPRVTLKFVIQSIKTSFLCFNYFLQQILIFKAEVTFMLHHSKMKPSLFGLLQNYWIKSEIKYWYPTQVTQVGLSHSGDTGWAIVVTWLYHKVQSCQKKATEWYFAPPPRAQKFHWAILEGYD